jgi:hypothetical protein
MNCDICGREMYESRVGWWCNAHRLRMSCVEDRRMRERTNSAIVSFICGLLIVVTIIGSLFVRGCLPAEAVADSICEECGQIIVSADRGHCHTTEVASCE